MRRGGIRSLAWRQRGERRHPYDFVLTVLNGRRAGQRRYLKIASGAELKAGTWCPLIFGSTAPARPLN